MSFGETIKRLRKEKGFTQDQLANLLNVTPQAISRWENNSAMPDISQLVPLANVFRVSTDTLLEVNVKETEKQITGVIHKMLDVGILENSASANDERIEILRDGIRRFPQDNSLKKILVGILSAKSIIEGPNEDPAVIREQISLIEDILDNDCDPHTTETYTSILADYHAKLNNKERTKELMESAPEMNHCREMILPDTLEGAEQIEARKDLIFKCTDTIIATIHDLYKENATDLTEEEWKALNRAHGVVEMVYGRNFSDYYMLVSQLYSRVHGAVSRENLQEALDFLEDIVRRLQLMERNGAEKSPLIRDVQHETLCLSVMTFYSVSYNANYVLTSMKKDFDLEAMRRENERFSAILEELERLSGLEESAFEKYCREKFMEYAEDGVMLRAIKEKRF